MKRVRQFPNSAHVVERTRVGERFESALLVLVGKMSRFFATGDTDTESSSESSDDEQKPVGGARGTTGAAIGSK